MKNIKYIFSSLSDSLINLQQFNTANKQLSIRSYDDATFCFKRVLQIILPLQQNDFEYNKGYNNVALGLTSCYIMTGQQQQAVSMLNNIGIKNIKKIALFQNKLLRLWWLLSVSNSEAIQKDIKRYLEEWLLDQEQSWFLLAKQVSQTYQKNEMDWQTLMRRMTQTKIEKIESQNRRKQELDFEYVTNLLNIYKGQMTINLNTIKLYQQQYLFRPLLATIITLINEKNWLSSEGIIQTCLSNIQKQYKILKYLNKNQQYIIIKLLLSIIYRNMQRNLQANKIKQQFQLEFNTILFIAQVMINPSIFIKDII